MPVKDRQLSTGGAFGFEIDVQRSCWVYPWATLHGAVLNHEPHSRSAFSPVRHVCVCRWSAERRGRSTMRWLVGTHLQMPMTRSATRQWSPVSMLSSTTSFRKPATTRSLTQFTSRTTWRRECPLSPSAVFYRATRFRENDSCSSDMIVE